jgi:hypothetical protein
LNLPASEHRKLGLEMDSGFISGSERDLLIITSRKWVARWGALKCGEIAGSVVEEYILDRSKISACTANKDLRYLRATFNYGLAKKLITLGHENRRTTVIYLHSIGEMERDAMAACERARKKSHTVSHTEGEGQKKRVSRGHLTLFKN